MPLVKITVLILFIINAVMDVSSFPLWIASSFTGIIILLISSKVTVRHIAGKNLFILSFTIFFSLFIVLSSFLQKTEIDHRFILITALRIVLVYNIIIIGLPWLGRNGFLYIVDMVPSLRLKLFLVLFYRSVFTFTRDLTHIRFQISARINLEGRNRFLIPRYYAQNIIVKNLYSFQHNQAALISRFPGHIPVTYREKAAQRDMLVSLCLLVLLSAHLVLQITPLIPTMK